MKIGTALKAERRALNLSQSEMAAGVVSPSFYAKVERNEDDIGSQKLIAILNVHQIKLADFFGQFETKEGMDLNKHFSLEENLRIAYYHNDLKKCKLILKKAHGLHAKKLELLATMNVAKLENKISDLSLRCKKEIKAFIFSKAKNWNNYSLRLLNDALDIYNFDELMAYFHILVHHYHDVKTLCNSTEVELLALAAHFLDICYRTKHYGEGKELLNMLKLFPECSNFALYKLVCGYYKNLFDGNFKEAKIIKTVLVQNGSNEFAHHLA